MKRFGMVLLVLGAVALWAAGCVGDEESCTPACKEGSVCKNGGCVSSNTECGNVKPVVEGKVKNSVADLDFTDEEVSIQLHHKLDIDEWEDGCISRYIMDFSKMGQGCNFHLEMKTTADAALSVTSATLKADSFCPGWSDADEGEYVLASSTLTLCSTVEVADYMTESACVHDVVLGFGGVLSLARTSDAKKLEVDLSGLKLKGDMSSSGNTKLVCPDLCGSKECGDDGCGGSCGSCPAPLSCVAGSCVGCGDGQCGAGEDGCMCPLDCGTCIGPDPFGISEGPFIFFAEFTSPIKLPQQFWTDLQVNQTTGHFVLLMCDADPIEGAPKNTSNPAELKWDNGAESFIFVMEGDVQRDKDSKLTFQSEPFTISQTIGPITFELRDMVASGTIDQSGDKADWNGTLAVKEVYYEVGGQVTIYPADQANFQLFEVALDLVPKGVPTVCMADPCSTIGGKCDILPDWPPKEVCLDQ